MLTPIVYFVSILLSQFESLLRTSLTRIILNILCLSALSFAPPCSRRANLPSPTSAADGYELKRMYHLLVGTPVAGEDGLRGLLGRIMTVHHGRADDGFVLATLRALVTMLEQPVHCARTHRCVASHCAVCYPLPRASITRSFTRHCVAVHSAPHLSHTV